LFDDLSDSAFICTPPLVQPHLEFRPRPFSLKQSSIYSNQPNVSGRRRCSSKKSIVHASPLQTERQLREISHYPFLQSTSDQTLTFAASVTLKRDARWKTGS
jgi:hypothetical protein